MKKIAFLVLFRYDGDFFLRNLLDSVEQSKKREKGPHRTRYLQYIHVGSCASGEFYFIGLILLILCQCFITNAQ